MAVLEIDVSKLRRNIESLIQYLPSESKIIGVLKADAYGSGIDMVIDVLEKSSVAKYAVATNREAAELIDLKVTKPLLILNPQINNFIFSNLKSIEPCIFSLVQLKEIDSLKFSSDSIVRIHLNLNTGMNRLGISEAEVGETIEVLKKSRHIELAGIYTHFSSSDDPESDAFSRLQIKLFEKIADKIELALNRHILTHIQNTNGVIRFPELTNDYVRIGIGMYGITYSNRWNIDLKLERVHRLYSKIIFIKQMREGESIGYGQTYMCPKEMRIATISIGYADGIQRRLSYTSFRLQVCNKEVKILGRISMDLISIDITDVDEAEIGTEAIFFSEQKPIEEMSNALDTIPYEILTNLGSRVERILLS